MEKKSLKQKIIIGTAQLKSNYGISNLINNKYKTDKAISLLNYCVKKKIRRFDTAPGYKNEKFIGNFFKNYCNTKINPLFITKIPTLKNFEDRKKIDIIKRSVNSSLNLLKHEIDTILFHDQQDTDFVKRNLDLIKKIFGEFKINSFGFSIYDLKFYNKIKNLNYDLTIQVPTNIINDIYLKKKFNKNLKIIGRSVFLQGLLLNQKIKRGYHKELYKSHNKYLEYMSKNSLNLLSLSTSIFSSKQISSFVLGVDSVDQLKKILNNKPTLKKNKNHIKKVKSFFRKNQLYDPRKWSISS